MKAITTVMAACILSFHATVDAQQTETPEEAESRQGIPATPHQEEAAREISSDLFKQLDEDQDGSISAEEAQAESSLSSSWSTYDQNGDETLDPEEFSGFERSSTSSAEEESAAAGQSATTEESMPASPHQQHAVQGDLIQELDTDGDGQISQQEAEAEAQLSDNWDQFDRNDDGKLDSRELARVDQ